MLEEIAGDGETTSESRGEESRLLEAVAFSFDFIFVLHLMRTQLSISADLSNALQRKEQDILNAMDLVSITKAQMSGMRSVDGWLSLMNEVKSFCSKNNVEIPAMDA